MNDIFKIAWRNLWRNRRRTMITSASVFFAVFFATIMRSYQLGTYDQMITNLIESYTGHLQIQHKEYQDNPMIDYSFGYDDTLISAVSRIKNVVSATPHLESFALASNGPQTKPVAIVAIDPLKERMFSNPENKLVKYRISESAVAAMEKSGLFPSEVLKKVRENAGRAYSSDARLELETGLTGSEALKYLPEILRYCKTENGFLGEHDDGVVISDRLAGYLKAGIGDTLVLLGQGYQGASAAGLFPVRGIIKMPSPEIDSRLIMMTIEKAQEFLDCPGKITTLAISLTGRSDRVMNQAKKEIAAIIPDGTTVKTWIELNPILYQQIQGDSQSGMLMLGLLYFIIFFGIFGTVLMMVAERRKEFGVLVSIGMQKSRLKRIILTEMSLLGVFGLAGGMAAASPLIMYFYYNPIVLKGNLGKMMEDYGWDAVMPAAWFGPYFYWQAVVVALMVIIASLYPMRKIKKLKEIEALRG